MSNTQHTAYMLQGRADGVMLDADCDRLFRLAVACARRTDDGSRVPKHKEFLAVFHIQQYTLVRKTGFASLQRHS